MSEKRTVQVLFFPYTVEDKLNGEKVKVTRYAQRGEEIELIEPSELERGEALGAFEGTEPPERNPVEEAFSPVQPPTLQELAEGGSPANLSDAEARRVVDEKNADEVVAAAGNDPDTAELLMRHEENRDGGPRKTVMDGLQKVIDQA